jgi:hypothetical protein
MIDAATAERFQRDGAVCIGTDENLAHLSPRAKVASGADDPGRFVGDFCNWQHNADYRRFIFDSALPETAGRLMQSTTVRLYYDHMLTKEPRHSAADALAPAPMNHPLFPVLWRAP